MFERGMAGGSLMAMNFPYISIFWVALGLMVLTFALYCKMR